MRTIQKLTQITQLVFQDRFKTVLSVLFSALAGVLVAWLTLKNPGYSWLAMAVALGLALVSVTLCCFILLVLHRSRTRLRYHWAADHLLRRDGFGFLVWFLALNGMVILLGSGLAFFLMWAFGPETWVIVVIAPMAACAAVALWGSFLSGRRPALALCWNLSLRPRDLSFWDLNKILFLPGRFGMAVDLDRRAEFPLLCDVARVLDLRGAGVGQRNLSLWEGGFSSFGSEIKCRLKVLSTVFGFTLLATLLLLLFLPSPNNQPWLGPLSGFGTPFSRAALSQERPAVGADREQAQDRVAEEGSSRSHESKSGNDVAGDAQSAEVQPNSEAGDSGEGTQSASSSPGDTSDSSSESGEKRSGESGSQGENSGSSQSNHQPGDAGEGGSAGDRGPQRPGQSGAPGDEGDGDQGSPGDREGGLKPDPNRTGVGSGEKTSQNQAGGGEGSPEQKKGMDGAEGDSKNPGSGESEDGSPSGSDNPSNGNESAQGMGSSPDSEAKGSGGKAGESAGENTPQDGESQGEGDPEGSNAEPGKGGKSSSPGKNDQTPIMADPSRAGGNGAVRVAFPPPGDGELVTLELPPMGEQADAAQDPGRASPETAESRRGEPGTFQDDPFSPAKPGKQEKTAKPVQHLPNWVLSLLPETKQRRQKP